MPNIFTMIFGFMLGLALRNRKRAGEGQQTGLLKPGKRPALRPEDRTKLVESLIYAWPNPSSLTLDFSQLETAPYRAYVPARIVIAFLSWRGASDRITSWPAMKAVDALIRQVVSVTEPACHYDKSDIPDWMTPLNDDELRSINKMWMASIWAKTGDTGSLTYDDIAEDIEDYRAFGAYALAVADHHKQEKARQAAHAKAAAKRREAALTQDPLADGWFAFLASLDGPDIPLWHDIATDFDELYGDRLNAVYWILEQPECDRATAWEFVVEAILNEFLLSELMEDNRNPDLAVSRRGLFEAVLHRWSEGFYRYHSLRIGERPAYYLETLQSEADRQTAAAVQPPIRLPDGFTTHLGPPTDDLTRSCSHGYTYSATDGLEKLENL